MSKNSLEQQIKIQMQDSVGLGIDIVKIERMQAVLNRTPRFKERVFTQDERALCEKSANPCVQYAMRFAAKQAVLKALDTSFWQGIAPHDLEILRSSTGRPRAKLHRKAAEAAQGKGVLELALSLSFTHAEAVACATAITGDSVAATKKRQDPMKELSRQFKEARQLLDKPAVPLEGQDTLPFEDASSSVPAGE